MSTTVIDPLNAEGYNPPASGGSAPAFASPGAIPLFVAADGSLSFPTTADGGAALTLSGTAFTAAAGAPRYSSGGGSGTAGSDQGADQGLDQGGGGSGGVLTGYTWGLSSLTDPQYPGTVTTTKGGVDYTVDVVVYTRGGGGVDYDFGLNAPSASPVTPGRAWGPGAAVWVGIKGVTLSVDGTPVTGADLLSLSPALVFSDDGGAETDPVAGEVIRLSSGAYAVRAFPPTVQPPGASRPAASVVVYVAGVRAGALDVRG